MNTGIIASRYATALLKLVDETGSGEVVAAQVQILGKALDESVDFRRAVVDPAVSPAGKIALFDAAVSLDAEDHQPAGGSAGVPVPPASGSDSQAGGSAGADSPVAGAALAPELRKFLALLIRNRRIGDIRLILTTFITEYYRSRHIMRANLAVADQSLLASDRTCSEPGSAEGPSLRQAQRPVGEPAEQPQRPTLESRLRALIEAKTGCRLLLSTEVNPSLTGGFVFEVEDTVLDASVSRQIAVIRRQFIEKNRRIV